MKLSFKGSILDTQFSWHFRTALHVLVSMVAKVSGSINLDYFEMSGLGKSFHYLMLLVSHPGWDEEV